MRRPRIRHRNETERGLGPRLVHRGRPHLLAGPGEPFRIRERFPRGSQPRSRQSRRRRHLHRQRALRLMVPAGHRHPAQRHAGADLSPRDGAAAEPPETRRGPGQQPGQKPEERQQLSAAGSGIPAAELAPDRRECGLRYPRRKSRHAVHPAVERRRGRSDDPHPALPLRGQAAHDRQAAGRTRGQRQQPARTAGRLALRVRRHLLAGDSPDLARQDGPGRFPEQPAAAPADRILVHHHRGRFSAGMGGRALRQRNAARLRQIG